MLSRTERLKVDPKNSVPSRFKRFSKTPKGYALGALLLLTLLGGFAPLGPRGIAHAAIAATAALGFDAAVALGLRRQIPFSVGGLITGLIIADVLSPLTPIWVMVVAIVIALGSKHVLKRGRKPLFNPAAFGLLASIVLFSTGASWWAAMPLRPLWEMAVFLAIGIFVAVRVKKYASVLMFLGTYFALMMALAVLHLGLASATPADALRPPFLNSALFLAFFMLTDPPTSPAMPSGQIQFAGIAAAIAAGVYATMGGLAYLLAGLLIGNLWNVRLATAKKPVTASPGAPRRRFNPAIGAVIVGAFVVGAAVTAASSLRENPFHPAPAGSLGGITSGTPASIDGTWAGTVTQSVQPGAAVLTLSGPFNHDNLTLKLEGVANEGQFIIQGGQVTLAASDGTVWQGAIQSGPAGSLSALLTAPGSSSTMTIRIGVPTITGSGTRFTATVYGVTP